jgi:RNA polymerase primary sigma factor
MNNKEIYKNNEELFQLYNSAIDEQEKLKVRNQIIENNQKMVWKITMSYKNIESSYDLDDIFQEGIIGLIKAIEHFDVSLGYKFSTYAYYWIRQAIGRNLIDKGSIIRIPVHAHTKISKLLKKDIDELTDIEKKYIQQIQNIHSYSLNQKYINRSSNSNSFDTAEKMEYVEQEEIDDPEEVLDKMTYKDIIEEGILKCLKSGREQDVFAMRYGFLTYNKHHSLQEIGDKYKCSRERIRQILSGKSDSTRDRDIFTRPKGAEPKITRWLLKNNIIELSKGYKKPLYKAPKIKKGVDVAKPGLSTTELSRLKND